MDLSTTYLGLDLRTPLVPSAAQPLSKDLDSIKRLEDAGASAITLYSLFQEDVALESFRLNQMMTQGTESFAEALSYFPEPKQLLTGPQAYLDHLAKTVDTVRIPVIASLNGTTLGGWTDYAKMMQQAGAAALELNIYSLPASIDKTAEQIEKEYIDIVRAVTGTVSIPVAVKLSPFFTNTANMAKKLDEAGARGLVLFNRFYQPDIDLENLEVKPNVLLSTAQEQRLPMRWIAILYSQIKADMAATSANYTAEDCLKMLMVGAKATMLCSTILRNGPEVIQRIERGMEQWLTEHEYKSVRQLQGSMSKAKVDNPAAFERAQYMKSLASYRPNDMRQTSLA